MSKPQHAFHLVAPSPWPVLVSLAVLVLGVGGALYMHQMTPLVFWIGLTMVLFGMMGWFKDIIHEAVVEKHHSEVVQKGLRYGMILFIVSELMFFVAFFWAFFDASLFPTAAIGHEWPPKNITPVPPFGLPYLNTLILLLSATSLTWAHAAIRHKNQNKAVNQGLLITVLLGVIFTIVQIFEYIHTDFTIRDGVYGSNFYLLTGFHGAHVIIGTIFLFVCFVRSINKEFTPRHHNGFEFAAWYWHFVDVVWLFLFVFVYWWGS